MSDAASDPPVPPPDPPAAANDKPETSDLPVATDATAPPADDPSAEDVKMEEVKPIEDTFEDVPESVLDVGVRFLSRSYVFDSAGRCARDPDADSYDRQRDQDDAARKPTIGTRARDDGGEDCGQRDQNKAEQGVAVSRLKGGRSMSLYLADLLWLTRSRFWMWTARCKMEQHITNIMPRRVNAQSSRLPLDK